MRVRDARVAKPQSPSLQETHRLYRCDKVSLHTQSVDHIILQFSISDSAQDGIVALGKAHTRSAPYISSLPKVALETVPIFVWLDIDRSRPRRVECRPLPFFTPLSFSDVMLWPVHVQKVPRASEHLCPAKLQTRCDICCACQSICPFIPTDSGVRRTQKSLNLAPSTHTKSRLAMVSSFWLPLNHLVGPVVNSF